MFIFHLLNTLIVSTQKVLITAAPSKCYISLKLVA